MSPTTQTRPRTRSRLNAELVDLSKLENVERANRARNSKKGKAAAKKQQTTANSGQIAWDQLFVEGEIVHTTKSFMEKLRGAISKEEFKTIIKEVDKTMDGEKDNHCNQTYCSLNEARNDIFSLYTETLREEAGLVISTNIESLKYEKGQVKTKMGQIEYNMNRANARRAQRDNLLKEFDSAKKDLIQLTQEESELDTTGDTAKDELRAITAA